MNRKVLAVLVLAVAGAGLLWQALRPRDPAVALLDPALVRVVRTPGGMLEVATLERTEAFAWQVAHTCPLIDCGELLGKTTSEVQVKVHATYRIPLAPQWTLRQHKDHYELVVPPLEPRLPVAFDTAGMRIKTERQSWFSPAAGPNREAVLRNLGRELDLRARRPQALALAEQHGALTVAEFARRWMAEQLDAPKLPVRVTFAKPSALEAAKAAAQ